VHVAFNYVVRGGQRVRKDTKTHQDRWLAIDPDTCALIATYPDETGAALATVGAGLRDDAYLFSNDPAHSRPWNRIGSATRSLRPQMPPESSSTTRAGDTTPPASSSPAASTCATPPRASGSGDRVALAAYLGGSVTFDQAIADFAETYADQNERDYAALQAAVNDGKAEATTEI
jgi:hypothetical protein